MQGTGQMWGSSMWLWRCCSARASYQHSIKPCNFSRPHSARVNCGGHVKLCIVKYISVESMSL